MFIARLLLKLWKHLGHRSSGINVFRFGNYSFVSKVVGCMSSLIVAYPSSVSSIYYEIGFLHTLSTCVQLSSSRQYGRSSYICECTIVESDVLVKEALYFEDFAQLLRELIVSIHNTNFIRNIGLWFIYACYEIGGRAQFQIRKSSAEIIDSVSL